MENWGDKCKKWFSLLSPGLAAYPGGGEQMGQYLKGRHTAWILISNILESTLAIQTGIKTRCISFERFIQNTQPATSFSKGIGTIGCKQVKRAQKLCGAAKSSSSCYIWERTPKKRMFTFGHCRN